MEYVVTSLQRGGASPPYYNTLRKWQKSTSHISILYYSHCTMFRFITHTHKKKSSYYVSLLVLPTVQHFVVWIAPAPFYICVAARISCHYSVSHLLVLDCLSHPAGHLVLKTRIQRQTGKDRIEYNKTQKQRSSRSHSWFLKIISRVLQVPKGTRTAGRFRPTSGIFYPSVFEFLNLENPVTPLIVAVLERQALTTAPPTQFLHSTPTARTHPAVVSSLATTS